MEGFVAIALAEENQHRVQGFEPARGRSAERTVAASVPVVVIVAVVGIAVVGMAVVDMAVVGAAAVFVARCSFHTCLRLLVDQGSGY